jgi:hypothetical protein
LNFSVRMCLRPALILLGIACAAMPDPSQACNVPVFRYAMERWTPDPYQIVVYHQAGPRGAAFDLLQAAATDRKGAANYALRAVDVSQPEGKAAAEQRSIATYPWAEIYYPLQAQVRTPVWSGPLTLERARTILHSPSRSRLVQRLLGGEGAVWVLIKSGQDQKDRRALESLKANLGWASATLRIPETGVDANGNAIEVTDFKTYPVRFGLMEIAHDDPKEDLLVSALRRSEPDLGGFDEPMAFPVFGRGRALYALVGGGIQEKNIREACKSMLAWCSCEIKSLNPGTDLLIAADWSQPAGGRMVKDPVLPLTGLGGFLPDREPAMAAVPRSAAAPLETGASCKRTSAGGGAIATAEVLLHEAPVSRGAVALRGTETGASCKRTSAGGGAIATAVPTGAPEPAPVRSGSPLVRNVLYLAGGAGMAALALSLFLTRLKR